MILKVPFWIPVIAVVAAHASGAINVFTTASQILSGVDSTVNAIIDFKRWAPQVKSYIHATNTTSGVRVASRQHPESSIRARKPRSEIAAGNNRLRNGTTSSSQALLSGTKH